MIKVRVLRDRCQGHARCFSIAPELFDIDEYGNASERGDGTVPEHLLDKAQLVVSNCPERAVELVED